jgi:hypothetical protein
MSRQYPTPEIANTRFPLWKSILTIALMFATLKTLGHWFSESIAWAIAGFVLVILTHRVPPKTDLSLWTP